MRKIIFLFLYQVCLKNVAESQVPEVFFTRWGFLFLSPIHTQERFKKRFLINKLSSIHLFFIKKILKYQINFVLQNFGIRAGLLLCSLIIKVSYSIFLNTNK